MESKAARITGRATISVGLLGGATGALISIMLAYSSLVGHDRVQASQFEAQQKEVDNLRIQYDKFNKLTVDVAVIRTRVEDMAKSIEELKNR